MTLIVYSKGVLYADDRVIRSEYEGSRQIESAQKIHLTDCRRVAVAYLGAIPWRLDLELITKVVAAAVITAELDRKPLAIDDELVSSITSKGKTDFIVMTWKNAYTVSYTHLTLPTNREV